MNVDYITQLKHRERALLERRLKLVKDNGINYYRPHPKQDSFHRAGRFLRRMARCGNRFGKSKMGSAEDVAWARGEREWLPKDDPARYEGIPKRPTRGLIITIDWDLSEAVFTARQDPRGKLFELLPVDSIVSVSKNHSGKIDTIHVKGKYGVSIIKLETVKSFASNPLGVESLDWDYIHVDEPCPQAMWKGASRGLVDRGGKAWFTLTPLREPWINDMFFPNMLDHRKEKSIVYDNGIPVFWAMTGSMYDNPYLKEEDIRIFEKSLSEEERQCRISGLPMHLAGLIYREFRPDSHVLRKLPLGWKEWNAPPKDWPKYFYVDPHPQTPHAVLFVTVDHTGRLYVYDEIFLKVYSSQLAGMIRDKLRGHFVPRPGRCDPSAFQPDPISGDCVAFDMQRNGVLLEKATKDLSGGIIQVKNALAADRIRVMPHCTRFLWEIARYAWDDKNGEPRNKPVDKDDHMMENFYRAVLDKPMWCEPSDDDQTVVSDIVIPFDQPVSAEELNPSLAL
jgi:hypothetical protein